MSLVGLTSRTVDDIATVIGITIHVHKALRESACSATEHQALLADLDSFSQLLRTVQIAHSISSRGLDEETTALGRTIRHSLSYSNVLLGEVYANITGYQTTSKRGSESMKDPSREMKWFVFDKEDTKQIRRRLSRYAQSLTTLLSVLQSQSGDRLEEISRESRVSLTQLVRYTEQLPQMLGYPWEGGASAASKRVVLQDMLGQKIFGDILKVQSERQAGSGFVYRGDFDLATTDHDASLTPIISHRRNSLLAKDGTRECPGCKRRVRIEENIHLNDLVQCAFCQTWFLVTEGRISEEVQNEASNSLGLYSLSPTSSSFSIPTRAPIHSTPSESEGLATCICGESSQDGHTIRCGGCSRYYHTSCVEFDDQIQPNSDWRCSICVFSEIDGLDMVAISGSPPLDSQNLSSPTSQTPNSDDRWATRNAYPELEGLAELERRSTSPSTPFGSPPRISRTLFRSPPTTARSISPAPTDDEYSEGSCDIWVPDPHADYTSPPVVAPILPASRLANRGLFGPPSPAPAIRTLPSARRNSPPSRDIRSTVNPWATRQPDVYGAYTPPPTSPLTRLFGPRSPSYPTESSPPAHALPPIDDMYDIAFPWETWQPDPYAEYSPIPPSKLPLQAAPEAQRGLFGPPSPSSATEILPSAHQNSRSPMDNRYPARSWATSMPTAVEVPRGLFGPRSPSSPPELSQPAHTLPPIEGTYDTTFSWETWQPDPYAEYSPIPPSKLPLRAAPEAPRGLFGPPSPPSAMETLPSAYHRSRSPMDNRYTAPSSWATWVPDPNAQYTPPPTWATSRTLLGPGPQRGLFGSRSPSPLDETAPHAVRSNSSPLDDIHDVVSDSCKLKTHELYPPFPNPLPPHMDDIWRERFALPTFFST